MNELKESYYRWLEQQYEYTAATKTNYQIHIRQIDLEHLESSLLEIRQEKSDKTFNLAVTALRSFASFLEEEYPENEIISKIRRVKSIRSPRSKPYAPYTLSEVRKILDAARGWRRIALLIAMYTGLRRDEIRKLDMDDVDLDTGIITVWEGKGRKMRHVAIPAILRDKLMKWTQLRDLQDVASKSLLISNRGRRPNLQSGGVLKSLSDKVGFKVSWHRCRATYATQLYRRSKDIKLVQRQLGHANSSTTDRYVQRSLNEISGQIQDIGDIYE